MAVMPTGTMQWFDTSSGEGRVVASGREYPVFAGDVEPRARAAGSRVHFDVERVNGVPMAVRVRAKRGTRSSRRQRRFGDLAGARRPEEKGRSPLTRQSGDVDPVPVNRPTELVRRWLAAADSGHLSALLPLYAPQAVLHAPDGDRHGRNNIRAFLVDSGLLSRGWDARPHGSDQSDQIVTAIRGPTAPDRRRVTRFRIDHGEIVEQWVEEPQH
jgi:cold shock CspA family protein